MSDEGMKFPPNLPGYIDFPEKFGDITGIKSLGHGLEIRQGGLVWILREDGHVEVKPEEVSGGSRSDRNL